jgi:hypothetical protein
MHKTGREARNAFRPALFCGGTEKKGKKDKKSLLSESKPARLPAQIHDYFFGGHTCPQPFSTMKNEITATAGFWL